MGVLKDKDWSRFESILRSGFPVNMAWSGIGSLFNLFVLACSFGPRQKEDEDILFNIIDLFIENGLSHDASTPFEFSPMAVSCVTGRLDFVKRLDAAGFPLFPDTLNTPVEVLLSRHFLIPKFNGGVEVNVFEKHLTQVLEFLKEKGLDFNKVFLSGSFPLLCAARDKNWRMCEWLIQNGAKPNMANNDVYPLSFAIMNKDSDTTQILIEAGADPKLPSFGMWKNHYELCAFMGTNQSWRMLMNATDSAHEDFKSGVFIAIKEGRPALLDLAPHEFLNVPMVNENGLDLLNAVAESGHSSLLSALERNGIAIEPHVVHDDNLSPYMRLVRLHGIEKAIDFGWAQPNVLFLVK